MDKLKPIIAHKFWIFFGLALIMPVVGWYMASNKVKADIETRTSAISQALTAAGSGTNENKDWANKLNEITDVQEKEFHDVSKSLYLEQKKLMVWPTRMRKMSTIEYRGEFAATLPKYYYKDHYADFHNKVYLKVDPIRVDLQNKVVGNIRCDQSGIHHAPINSKSHLTWKAIWDAQEDLWLTQSLLESIKRINGEERITEVPIRELAQLMLVGGSRSGEGDSSAAPVAAAAPGSDDMYEGDNEGEYGDDEMGGGGMGGMGVPSAGSIDFPVEDEFGSPGGGAAGGAVQFGASSAGSGRRYVDDDVAMPFKTRGFKLNLVVKQSQVPMVLTELMKSKWPVEIVRYHQQDLHLDGSAMASAGGGMYGGGGGGMYGEDDEGDYEDEGSYGGAAGYGGGAGGFGAAGGFGGAGGFGAAGGFGGANSYGGNTGFGGAPAYGAGTSAYGAAGYGNKAGGRASAAAMKASQKMMETVASAMDDKYLVRLVVSGTITLYREPEELSEQIKTETAAVAADPNAFRDDEKPEDGTETPGTGDQAPVGTDDALGEGESADGATDQSTVNPDGDSPADSPADATN